MNMLEQLLSSAGQAADSSRNPFLPAGEHKVAIRTMGYRDGRLGRVDSAVMRRECSDG